MPGAADAKYAVLPVVSPAPLDVEPRRGKNAYHHSPAPTGVGAPFAAVGVVVIAALVALDHTGAAALATVALTGLLFLQDRLASKHEAPPRVTDRWQPPGDGDDNFEAQQGHVEAVRCLGLPAVFEAIAQGQPPRELEFTCQAPRVSLEHPSVQSGRLAPLRWETNGDSMVAFDRDEDCYVSHHFEDAGWETVANSYQQLVTWLLATEIDGGYWQEASIEDAETLAELERLASTFDYQHLDALVAFFGAGQDVEGLVARIP